MEIIMSKTFIPSLFFAIVFSFLAGCTNSGVSVSSPDGNLKLNLVRDHNAPAISIDYKGERIIMPSPIGFEFEEGSFGTDIKMSPGKLERITDANARRLFG